MFEISVVCPFATNPAATRDFTIPHNSQFFTILRRLIAKAPGVVSDQHNRGNKSPIGIWRVGGWDVTLSGVSGETLWHVPSIINLTIPCEYYG